MIRQILEEWIFSSGCGRGNGCLSSRALVWGRLKKRASVAVSLVLRLFSRTTKSLDGLERLTGNYRMASNQSFTENSPLLGENNTIVPTGAIVQRDAETGEPSDPEQSGKQPFPDAKKQLKYIVPAISIGVRRDWLSSQSCKFMHPNRWDMC